ncbi:MAG: hypothetical protein K8R69_08065 [Deltaproteobacteria bacterium]|nr:hypothetical protein [Deltaproteobacteria bacterium]
MHRWMKAFLATCLIMIPGLAAADAVVPARTVPVNATRVNLGATTKPVNPSPGTGGASSSASSVENLKVSPQAVRVLGNVIDQQNSELAHEGYAEYLSLDKTQPPTSKEKVKKTWAEVEAEFAAKTREDTCETAKIDADSPECAALIKTAKYLHFTSRLDPKVKAYFMGQPWSRYLVKKFLKLVLTDTANADDWIAAAAQAFSQNTGEAANQSEALAQAEYSYQIQINRVGSDNPGFKAAMQKYSQDITDKVLPVVNQNPDLAVLFMNLGIKASENLRAATLVLDLNGSKTMLTMVCTPTEDSSKFNLQFFRPEDARFWELKDQKDQ